MIYLTFILAAVTGGALEAARHWYIIERKKRNPSLHNSMILRGLGLLFITGVWLSYGNPWWCLLMAFFVAWQSFETLLNVFRGRAVYEMDDDKTMDKIQLLFFSPQNAYLVRTALAILSMMFFVYLA
jgi:hypothetical protein